jgi:predicted metal-dependent HD superfamily phosphohydrolase
MSTDSARILATRWRDCFVDLSLDAPEGVFAALIERYSEPHRAYHTVQHIADCFQQFDDAKGDMNSRGAVGLALWFHDAIYEPRAPDNERKSAQWARAVLEAAGASSLLVTTVENLILATQHDAEPKEHDARIVVDIDLSILGAPEDRYRQYESQIRHEYAWVEDAAFRQGRIAVLRHFFDRPQIYSTERFRAQLEKRARQNIEREMRSLS